ncbi:hypothetical protein ACCO45_013969 [Purpureocillium lilacinum]|uniref:Uncharacterized protein n=1 Tax=Purpureocillium lilacinum TaxID=33203 RepID=A0ACC4D7D6_PURLI
MPAPSQPPSGDRPADGQNPSQILTQEPLPAQPMEASPRLRGGGGEGDGPHRENVCGLFLDFCRIESIRCC